MIRVKLDLPEPVYRRYLARARALGMDEVGELVEELLLRPFVRRRTGRPRSIDSERVREIGVLRRQGFTWREVGDRLGLSASGACKAWHRAVVEGDVDG